MGPSTYPSTLKVNVLSVSSHQTEAHQPEVGLKPQTPQLQVCVCTDLEGTEETEAEAGGRQEKTPARKVTWTVWQHCPSFFPSCPRSHCPCSCRLQGEVMEFLPTRKRKLVKHESWAAETFMGLAGGWQGPLELSHLVYI